MRGRERPVARSRYVYIRFLVVFGGLMGLFYAVATTESFDARVFQPYLRLSTEISAQLLGLLGQGEMSVDNTTLTSSNFDLTVARGCDGIEATALFVALILAFPAAFVLKVPAIVIGVPLLASVNLVRIVSLFLVGTYYPPLFHVMHVDVWQILFILIALGSWALWFAWATQSRTVGGNAPH